MSYLRLDEVCNLKMGQSPDSGSYNQERDGIPFFQGNADFGEMHPVTRTWCNNPTKVVDKGTLLISVRAPIGALNFAVEKSCIGRGLAGITAKNEYDLKYIYYALKYKNRELKDKGTGSTFKTISKSTLGKVLIRDMTIENQRECIKRLDLIYKIFVLKKEKIRQYDELIKSRFVEMFGDPVKNQHGYPLVSLSEYIDFLTSGSRGWAKYCVDDGDEWFITIKNVKNCRISTENMQSVHAPKNAEAQRTRVQEGDLLISITADLGRTGVVSKEIANHGAYINQHLSCIRLKKGKLLPLYVAYFMESPAGKMQFFTKNQSAVKAGLNFDSIKSLRLLAPPIKLQENFVSFIDEIDKSKFATQKALTETQQLFDSLMQKYFG